MTVHRGYVTGDFDNYITAGTWDHSGSGTTHSPGVGWGKLRVNPGYYITQEFLSDKSYSMRIRTEKNVWTDWKTYITTTDLNGLKPGAVFEVGQYLDFHTAGSTADYDGRLYIDDNTHDLIYRIGNVKYKLNTTVV